eukprot:11224482-Lingulodinium_polyedra.AAC.1
MPGTFRSPIFVRMARTRACDHSVRGGKRGSPSHARAHSSLMDLATGRCQSFRQCPSSKRATAAWGTTHGR